MYSQNYETPFATQQEAEKKAEDRDAENKELLKRLDQLSSHARKLEAEVVNEVEKEKEELKRRLEWVKKINCMLTCKCSSPASSSNFRHA